MSRLYSFCHRILAAGVRDDAPPHERNKIYITKGSSLFLVAFGPIFMVLNLVQGYVPLALVNLASTVLGLVCLWLVKRRIVRTAAVLLILGCSAIFLFSGLIFHNGMEYTLLLCMLGAVFLFEKLSVRLLLAFVIGADFLLVRILHFDLAERGQFPLPRYAINLALFLLGYYLILEIFCTVNRNYQLAIEQKNRDLAKHRRELDEERVALIARTSELQIANQAKEKLFSLVAHDLRGPVGNLKNTLELLESKDLTPEDFQGMVTELKVGVDVAYECLDTLLLWSAKQLREIKPIFTRVSLAREAQDCVALLADMAAHKGIAMHHGIPAEAWVEADETQVSSIFRNLVSNALKFTRSGGMVDLSAIKEGEFWRVTVADTGVGMSAEQIRQFLESSEARSTIGTENERGWGLGLQICQEFIQHNRGSLSIESEEGKGTSFHFFLPAAGES